MERLWAPWRMTYINGINDKGGCFLCDVLGSDDDARDLVVARNEHSFVVLNRFPYNNGHTLVCPNDHKADLDELTDREMGELMRTTAGTMKLLKKAIRPDGFNVGMNFGRVAGAGLPGHLHIHIVPRWNGDTNFMPVLAEVKIIPQALEDLCRLLVKARQEG
ncbi:MAG: HIT domain-containing protein [Anaerolineaceae bacterium]|nr:HIT domain-containing protein [Anaerolineaceae bacterium]